MRTLSAALIAAAQTPGSVPDLKLELADIWPHFATITSGGGGGPCAAAIAPDGAVVAAYVGTGAPNTVYAQRVTDPASAAQWAVWATISADSRAQAGVCLCVAGATVRLLWQSAAGTAVRYADSADSGLSWGAPATLFDPGKPLYGIAADGDLAYVLIAYLTSGLFARLAAWHLAGVWSGTDWTNGDLNTITGLAATRTGPGAYNLALALQGAAGEAYSIQSCSYAAGGTPVWTALAPVATVDTVAGVLVLAPHLAQFDGGYALAYAVQDTGAVSGIAYTRVARLRSADFAHWQAPLEDQQSFPSGACWIKHATCTLLTAAEAVRRAALYSAATGYRDCTADLIKLDLVERAGEPARLVATLDNSGGAYTASPALLPNAQLLLSQGFVGAGLIPTHLLYLEEWTFARAADEGTVTLVAHDRARFLARQTRAPLSYSGQSAGTIGADLAVKAGFDTVSVDAASQFGQVLPLFQAHAGRGYAEALARLLAVYDGFAQARTLPGAGIAFGAVDLLRLGQKGAADPVVWTYNGEPEYLHLTHAGDRANRVAVFGPQITPTALAEAIDWADIAATGQERPAVLVEGLAVSAAAAALAAAQALARETRLATRVALAVGPQPGLEPFDVIAVQDGVVPAGTCRLAELHLTVYPLGGLHELVLLGEGV